MNDRVAGSAELRNAAAGDAAEVAAVHMRCLPESASDFTALGRRIVARFYANVIARGLGTVIVGERSGRMVGFVLVTRDVSALFTRSLLDGPRDLAAFLFRVSPLGLLRAVRNKITSGTAQIPTVPELVYLAVDERFRGQGHGATLMDAAEDWFRRAGISYYELNVDSANPPALGLYLAKGMTIKRSYMKHGLAMHTLSRRLEAGR